MLFLCSDEYLNSFWQCFHVLWEDGATDHLSPWDMEPIPEIHCNPHSDTFSDQKIDSKTSSRSDSEDGEEPGSRSNSEDGEEPGSRSDFEDGEEPGKRELVL